jgi:hypothetical protein
MAHKYYDEPEFINPYRDIYSGSDSSSVTLAVFAAIVFGLSLAAYAIY